MDLSAFENGSNSFHQSRTNVYMPENSLVEYKDSDGISRRTNESQCDALFRHRFGPGLAMLDGCLYELIMACLLYTSPSPRDVEESRMPSSA